jgi:hypothetical protein
VQALPWFDDHADLEAELVRQRSICWGYVLNSRRQPDVFFRSEDLFVALATRLGRVREVTDLLETIVNRAVDPAESAAYAKSESKRLRRLARSKRAVIVEPLPHWHDGATNRLQALRQFRATSGTPDAG